MLETTLGRLAAGEDLSMDEMSAAVEAIMGGQCSEGEIGLTSILAVIGVAVSLLWFIAALEDRALVEHYRRHAEEAYWLVRLAVAGHPLEIPHDYPFIGQPRRTGATRGWRAL